MNKLRVLLISLLGCGRRGGLAALVMVSMVSLLIVCHTFAEEEEPMVICPPNLIAEGIPAAVEEKPGGTFEAREDSYKLEAAFTSTIGVTNEELVLQLKGVNLKAADRPIRIFEGMTEIQLPYKWPASQGGKTFKLFALGAVEKARFELSLNENGSSSKIGAWDVIDFMIDGCSVCVEGVGCGPGAVMAEVNSLDVSIGLPQVNYGESGGQLRLYTAYPSAALFKPDALTVLAHPDATVNETNGVLNSVVMPDGSRIDVHVVDVDDEYELRVKDSLGVITRTITVVNPDPASGYDTVHVVQSGDQDRIWIYSWSSQDEAWTMAEGEDAQSIVKKTTKTENQVDARTRVETTVVKETDDTEVSVIEETYYLFAWGEELIKRVNDPAGAAITEVWQYYDAGSADGDNSDRLKVYLNDGGYWTFYEYHPDGLVKRTITQLDNNAFDDTLDAATLAAQNVAVEFEEGEVSINNGSGSETVAYTREITKELGVVVGCSWTFARAVSAETNCDESWSVRCVTAGPATAGIATFIEGMIQGTDSDGHRVSKTWVWSFGQTEQFRVKRMAYSDGTVALYDYPLDGVTAVKRGYPNVAGDDIVQGTRVTTEVDEYGYAVSTLREMKRVGVNGGAWFIESMKVTTDWDSEDRPTETSHYYGADAKAKADGGSPLAAYTTGQTYGCCGVQTRTDRQGRETGYVLDSLNRVVATTDNQQEGSESQGGIVGGQTVRHVTYDAYGRTIKVEQEGSDGVVRLVAEMGYDLAGRVAWEKNALGDYTFYTYRRVDGDGVLYAPTDPSDVFYWETRVYPDRPSGGTGQNVWTAPPVQVTWQDSQGRLVREWAAKVSTGNWNSLGDGTPPDGSETLVEVSRVTANDFDWRGVPAETRSYFELPVSLGSDGTQGTHYYSTERAVYDFEGRMVRSTDVLGTITVVVYDDDGRVVETWVGTDDGSPTDPADYHNPASLSGNMVQVAATTYDIYGEMDQSLQFKANLTTVGTFDAANDAVATDYAEDYVVSANAITERILWTKPADGLTPWTKQVYDEQGRMVESVTYSNASTSYVLAKNTNAYDDSSGLMTQSRIYEVDGSGSTTGNYLETSYSYDSIGRRYKSGALGHGYNVTLYDAFGRADRNVLVAVEGSNPDPTVVSDDVVASEAVFGYDDADNVIWTEDYSRRHDALSSASGLLSDPANSGITKVQYMATWFDDAGRPVRVEDYGDEVP